MLDSAGIAIFLFVVFVFVGVIIYDTKDNLKFIFDKKILLSSIIKKKKLLLCCMEMLI